MPSALNSATPDQKRYRAHLQAGLCGKCGKVPPRPNRTLCQSCADKNAQSPANSAMAARKRYRKNRACRIKQRVARHLKDPRADMLIGAKRRAKALNLPFAITKDDLYIPLVCPVLGIPIHVVSGRAARAGSPSVDRVVPEVGYVSGNVCVISHRANLIKNNATEGEHRQVADYVARMTTNAFQPAS